MSSPQPGAQEVDLAAALGSDGGVSAQCFTVYIPNKDRHGQEIGNQRQWVLEAIRLLSEVNGGATAMPPVEGGWLNDQGEIIWESPVLVYSFIRPEPPALARIPAPHGARNEPGRSGLRVRRPLLPHPELRSRIGEAKPWLTKSRLPKQP